MKVIINNIQHIIRRIHNFSESECGKANLSGQIDYLLRDVEVHGDIAKAT